MVRGLLPAKVQVGNCLLGVTKFEEKHEGMSNVKYCHLFNISPRTLHAIGCMLSSARSLYTSISII